MTSLPRLGADGDSTLEARFRELVGSAPGAAFVHYFDGVLTYGEAEDRVSALASWLRTHGVARGDRVVLLLQNVPDFPIAVLASWRIGAVVVPINPMYQERELAGMFEDCAPAAIVCHDYDHGRIAAEAARMDRPCAIILSGPRDYQTRDDERVLPPAAATPDDVARIALLPGGETGGASVDTPLPEDLGLLLYTSGTTGLPKGAMHRHDALLLNARLPARWCGFAKPPVVYAMAPLFHITGFSVHLGVALSSGGSLGLNYRFQPAVVLEMFERSRPTFTVGSITAFMALMNHRDTRPDHFSSFEMIWSGGAPVPPPVAAEFANRFGKALHIAYGMTETGGASHATPPNASGRIDPESGSAAVGMPVPATLQRIVNDEGETLPVGETGELWVKAPQLMSGYWQRPEENAATFVDGWLRTGDIGKIDDAGWLYLVDRKKDMIIASGFKVWPREVEDVLYDHPAVREVAVVGVPDSYRGETVKAVVALKSDARADAAGLEAHCRANLAPYKVPRLYEFLDDLPKTLTGKIIRAAVR